MNRKRVVLVCMVDSIHVARWIAQFDASQVEFTLFPSTPNRRVHSMIEDLMAKKGNIKIEPFGGRLSILLWGVDRVFSDYIRGLLLRRLLKDAKPDFVHALELQHGGYITSRALEDRSIKTKFIATNYGSDIYWFQQFPKHLAKTKKLLARADRYSAECNRDVKLAKKYGFNGEVMPVFPNAGGFTLEQLSRPLKSTADRNVIAIKGYEGWVGRASVAVEALYSLTQELAAYRIVFYSCNKATVKLLKRAKQETKLNLEWHEIGALSHEDMTELFSLSKLYLGLSLSDGISTSVLEAMAFGAFPIQSSTACVSDWFEPGIDGLVVDSLDKQTVIQKIHEALSMESTFFDVRQRNRETIQQRASYRQIAQAAQAFYTEESQSGDV